VAKRGDRATHCKHGHEFTPANTRLQTDGRGSTYQSCRTCQAATQARQREDGYFERYQLQRRYGITIEDRDRMLADQGGVCAVCADRPAVVVDHDHATGAVRGLLCKGCNVAIGVLGDASGIQRALDYLSKPQLLEVV
jgi:Pyruvate/2-oxoacid:ferredoxin oxidoreductase delta subunit